MPAAASAPRVRGGFVPARVDISRDALERCLGAAAVHAMMREGSVTAACVAVVRAPRPDAPHDAPPFAHVRAFGHDVRREDDASGSSASAAPVVADARETVFDLGASAGAFTAMAALRLASEGALDLDRDLTHHLPPELVPDDRDGHEDAGGDDAPGADGILGDAVPSSRVFPDDPTPTFAPRSRTTLAKILEREAAEASRRPERAERLVALVRAATERACGVDHAQVVEREVLRPAFDDDPLAARRATSRSASCAAYPASRLTGTEMRDALVAVIVPARASPGTRTAGTSRGVLDEAAATRLRRLAFRRLGKRGDGDGDGDDGMRPRDDLDAVIRDARGTVAGGDALLALFPAIGAGIWIAAGIDETRGEPRSRFCARALDAFIRAFVPPSPSPSPSPSRASRWFRTLRPVPGDPAIDLFVLAGIGSSPATTFERWPRTLPDFVRARAVLLPGRGARSDEPHATDLVQLARDIADAIARDAVPEDSVPVDSLPGDGDAARPRDRPWALFGHGFGAAIAYEIARAAATTGDPPAHVFVSGRAAPSRDPDVPRLRLPGAPGSGSVPVDVAAREWRDEDFARAFVASSDRAPRQLTRASRKAPPGVSLDVPLGVSLGAMLDATRADALCDATYRWDPDSGRVPAGCPLRAFAGSRDEGASDAQLDGWRGAWVELGGGAFVATRARGGHHYLEEDEEGGGARAVKLVARALGRRVAGRSSWTDAMCDWADRTRRT